MRILLALLWLAASVVAVEAQPASVGRLTCSLDDARKSETSIGLSCAYQPVDGAEARLEGTISASSGMEDLAGRVFVWLVYGPPPLAAADLEGQFVRTKPPATQLDPALADALIGGLGGAIALLPPAGDEQIPDNPAVTILELSLKAIQT